MLNKIFSLSSRTWKVILFLGLFLFLSWEVFSAGEIIDLTSGSADNTTGNKTKEFIEAIDSVLKFITTIFWIIWGLVSWLLTPDWVNGSIFWMDQVLKKIWILASNIVYMVFAWIFVWIAFANIIWMQWSNYEMKNALPRLIVSILIVPFTWYIVQFVLSVTNILTYSMMYLPYWDINKDANTKAEICRVLEYTVDVDSDNSKNLWKKAECLEKGGNVSSFVAEMWPYAVVNYYLYNIVNQETIWEFKKAATENNLSEESFSPTALVVNILLTMMTVFLNIIALLVLFVIFVMLFFALMTRVIMLWLYIMFSPFLALAYFFGKDWWKSFESFNFSKFLSLAMVPVYVAAALSFWIVIMTNMKDWVSDWELGLFNMTYESSFAVPGEDNQPVSWVVMVLGGTDPKWEEWYKVVFSGIELENLTDFDTGETWSPVWIFIAYLFWICILWTAIVAALKTNEITWSAIQKFESMWTNIADIWKSIPAHTPLPFMNGQTFDSMWRWVSNFHLTVKNHSSSKAAPYERKIQDFMWVNSMTWHEKQQMETLIAQAKTESQFKDIFAKATELQMQYWKNDPRLQEVHKKIIEMINKYKDNPAMNPLLTKVGLKWKVDKDMKADSQEYARIVTQQLWYWWTEAEAFATSLWRGRTPEMKTGSAYFQDLVNNKNKDFNHQELYDITDGNDKGKISKKNKFDDWWVFLAKSKKWDNWETKFELLINWERSSFSVDTSTPPNKLSDSVLSQLSKVFNNLDLSERKTLAKKVFWYDDSSYAALDNKITKYNQKQKD